MKNKNKHCWIYHQNPSANTNQCLLVAAAVVAAAVADVDVDVDVEQLKPQNVLRSGGERRYWKGG